MLSEIQEQFLVVDDDESLRNLLEVILDSVGAKVISAANGPEAIAAMNSKENSICGVLLDLNLEDLPGEELLDQLIAIDPRVAIFPMSGCFGDEIRSRLGNRPYAGIITKPFLSADLVATLSDGIANRNKENASCEGV